MKRIGLFLNIFLVAIIGLFTFELINRYTAENKALKEVVARLEADSRIAEVLVTKVDFDEKTGQAATTIKFMEYDIDGNPVEPKYFSFSGNIIQFQSLVVRFDDIHIRNQDALKGKSAYLFWKVFVLNGDQTQEYAINEVGEIPSGYKLKNGRDSKFERRLWAKFWEYALDPAAAKEAGIKNAQIEAPGAMFVPGTLYTIKIEHDGGMRIDVAPLPDILRGELIL